MRHIKGNGSSARKAMQKQGETLLNVEIKGVQDLEQAEDSIRDHLIPVTLSREETTSPGIQPSFLMMNREYLRMKMSITRWLRSKDFILEEQIDLPNSLSIRYYTVYSESGGSLMLEMRCRDLVIKEDRGLGRACKRKSSEEEEGDSE